MDSLANDEQDIAQKLANLQADFEFETKMKDYAAKIGAYIATNTKGPLRLIEAVWTSTRDNVRLVEDNDDFQLIKWIFVGVDDGWEKWLIPPHTLNLADKATKLD